MKTLLALLTVTTFGLLLNMVLLMTRVDKLERDQGFMLTAIETHRDSIVGLTRMCGFGINGKVAEWRSCESNKFTFPQDKIGKPGQILCGDVLGNLEFKYPVDGHCPQ